MVEGARLESALLRKGYEGSNPSLSVKFCDKQNFTDTKASIVSANVSKLERKKIMDKYQCRACPYIYDPAVGDATQNIPAGTPFEDLPEDWLCPICGVPKTMFDKIG